MSEYTYPIIGSLDWTSIIPLIVQVILAIIAGATGGRIGASSFSKRE